MFADLCLVMTAMVGDLAVTLSCGKCSCCILFATYLRPWSSHFRASVETTGNKLDLDPAGKMCHPVADSSLGNPLAAELL